MRKLPGAVLVALLIPTAVAAQKTPAQITADSARSVALARVKTDLAAGRLKTWGNEGGRTIRPTTLAARADQVDDIYKTNAQVDDIYKNVYVVAVTSPDARGHVRVVVNRRTGAVVSSRVASWDWGNSPDWWVKGRDNQVSDKAKN